METVDREHSERKGGERKERKDEEEMIVTIVNLTPDDRDNRGEQQYSDKTKHLEAVDVWMCSDLVLPR